MTTAPKLSSNPRPAVFEVEAIDETGASRQTAIAGEHPLTIYLDKKELVTLMTLGAAPEQLVLGYLRNQRVVSSVSELAQIEVDWQTHAAAVTTVSLARDGVSCWERSALHDRIGHRTVTTGCGQGTMYGDVMSEIDDIRLDGSAHLTQSGLYQVLERVRQHESIYKQAGAVHGCALCCINDEGQAEILSFVEDVGRHNAADAIAGWMWLNEVRGDNKIFYTTGRLTSEMVIKCAQMRIPILVSRSGLTQMGRSLAQRLNMTLIGRCQGRHFLLFTGHERFSIEPVSTNNAMPARNHRAQITGLVLAAGRGSRMSANGQGTNKALQLFRGKPLVSHVIERLDPQVQVLLVNANQAVGEPRYPLVPDGLQGFLGPLAGIYAGLQACRTPWLLCAPCDSPFLPGDLAARLYDAATSNGRTLAVAAQAGQWQPVFALIHVSLAPSLESYLAAGDRKIDLWYRQHNPAVVEFSDESAFLNFNTLEELRRHE